MMYMYVLCKQFINLHIYIHSMYLHSGILKLLKVLLAPMTPKNNCFFDIFNFFKGGERDGIFMQKIIFENVILLLQI